MNAGEDRIEERARRGSAESAREFPVPDLGEGLEDATVSPWTSTSATTSR